MSLVGVWPRVLRTERARFNLPKEVYVKARYSRRYRINEEELVWLGGYIKELNSVARTLCGIAFCIEKCTG